MKLQIVQNCIFELRHNLGQTRINQLSQLKEERAVRTAVVKQDLNVRGSHSFGKTELLQSGTDMEELEWVQKQERTKQRWLQVLKNKEKVQKEQSITISKQLGIAFSRERATNKRLKEENEYEKTVLAKHSAHYQGVLNKRIQLEKHLNQEMKEIESKSEQKIDRYNKNRI